MMSVKLVSSYTCISLHAVHVIGLACCRLGVHHCIYVDKIKLQICPTKLVYDDGIV
jgi:hypothetical protein